MNVKREREGSPATKNLMRQLVHDDGERVTLDLHGVHLAEAEGTLRRTIAVATARGRTAVRVVHGSSTSDLLARNPTIKHLVEDLLAAGHLPEVTDAFSMGEATILSLPLRPARDRRRIVARDVL